MSTEQPQKAETDQILLCTNCGHAYPGKPDKPGRWACPECGCDRYKRTKATQCAWCGVPGDAHANGCRLGLGPDEPGAQAEALREAARRFIDDMADAWGGDAQWLTTGTRVAEVVACVLREWAADLEGECSHEWLDRPESDTRQCLICGTEVAG